MMKTAKILECVIEKYRAQEVLFAQKVSRISILNLQVNGTYTNRKRINIWRNHSIEPMIEIIDIYTKHSGWQLEYWISPYDDTLLFAGYTKADVELLWIDTSRFHERINIKQWTSWVDDRIKTLRAMTTAPIILATWLHSTDVLSELQSLTDSIPSVYFVDLMNTCQSEGVALLDHRSTNMAGTPISSKAQLIIARKLACHWLPAVLFPPIKALALDLDNTLHQGVLGEDGIDRLELTPAHIELQLYIKSLQEKGIFLALVSRNEYQDVKKLFNTRKDYPLRWEDFSSIEVSWGEKIDALERIEKQLRIGLDSILFVDDNVGELASVTMQFPQIHTVCAYNDANITRNSILYYPGLWRWRVDLDDKKRIKDLKASAEREELVKNFTNLTDYFASLQITICYYYNSLEHLKRFADLCSKTNQFNLSLRRFTEVELMEYMNNNKCCVVGVQLTDRLSDSGIVAVIVAKRQSKTLIIEELCISCRALGRKLEDTIIIIAIRDMPIFSGCDTVIFHAREGPRNQPAIKWLSSLLKHKNGLPTSGYHEVSAQELSKFMPIENITLHMIKG